MKTLLKKSNENSERVLFEHDVSARRTARSNTLSALDRGVYLLKRRDKVLFTQFCEQALRGGAVDGVQGGEVGFRGRAVGEVGGEGVEGVPHLAAHAEEEGEVAVFAEQDGEGVGVALEEGDHLFQGDAIAGDAELHLVEDAVLYARQE